jgi:iron complex outermembrane receptor protein
MHVFTNYWRRFLALGLLALAMPLAQPLVAQQSGTLTGTILDAKGSLVPNAKVSIKNETTGAVTKVKGGADGYFSASNLPVGSYTVSASALGFAITSQNGVAVIDSAPNDVELTLNVAGSSTEVTVEADATGSIAAAYAPMDALLTARSARTEISQAFIQNFTSPLADFGEAVEMAPSTFTLNGNGVGLGQSKTYFRGFPDGDYDIDFDGIPFYDTNSPTHHSWAFFPSQWLGGIDFDRSPGSASTIGPTPFGGTIHLLSKELSPIRNIRGGISYGSWGTLLADFQFDSGSILPNHKLAMFVDVQHMDSKGYLTENFQNRNAGSIKLVYQLSDKTTLTGFSGVVWVDANTPNFSGTRCQMYGTSAATAANPAVTCLNNGVLLPYTGAGIRFLNANNTDPVDYLDAQYNTYHVPTDFEYVGVHTEQPHNIVVDFKPYTYNYDNSERFSNVTPITESSTVNFNGNPASTTWYGYTVAPCNVAITKKGVTAIPCGVDKYNSYRKYGETLQVSQSSKFGVLRAGLWYEWALTNRHQFPSDPLNNWADQPLSNFNETFWTNSYQPFAEYEFHVGKKLNITAGTKFAYYTVRTKQYADDGKTIGGLGTNNPATFITNGGNFSTWLPSLDANYRIRRNWSVYGQIATGSIVPPSSVFDYNQGTSGTALLLTTPAKQQRSTTYQAGTVLKLKRVTFDGDVYRIRFQNSYSSFNNASTGGEPAFFLQPSSITKGLEGESNIYIGHGLSAYLNASYDSATYTGSLPVACNGAPPNCAANGSTPTITESAPGGLNVQQTPSDVEAEGVTYQRSGFDLGFFNKRVGTFYMDDGSYHNQATVNPFDVANAYLNYTIRKGSHFDQTRIRLSVNNLFDSHTITGVTPAGSVVNAPVISANGTTYPDAFNTIGQAPINGGDTISVLPGRSIVLSITFGFSPHRD